MPPQPTPSGDFLDTIAQLERRIAELERRTLRSVVIPEGGLTVKGDGGVSVVDPDEVERFRAAADGVTVRDESGTVIFSNNNTSGWGMSLPNIQTPFNRYEPLYPAEYFSATTFGNIQIASHVVNHPSVAMGANTRIDTAGANVEVRYIWSQISSEPGPTEFTIMGTLNGVGDLGPVTYTFPSDKFGEHVYVIMQARRSAGTGLVTAQPAYFYGKGN